MATTKREPLSAPLYSKYMNSSTGTKILKSVREGNVSHKNVTPLELQQSSQHKNCLEGLE